MSELREFAQRQLRTVLEAGTADEALRLYADAADALVEHGLAARRSGVLTRDEYVDVLAWFEYSVSRSGVLTQPRAVTATAGVMVRLGPPGDEQPPDVTGVHEPLRPLPGRGSAAVAAEPEPEES